MSTDLTDLTDLTLRCSCDSMTWVARGVSGSIGNRLVCYCDDCQSFGHFLGDAERILDAHGGSDIFQMSPARLEIPKGADQLACLRLRPGGLVRWYAGCCNTPIGNTLATRQVPFVGLIQRSCDTGEVRDDALGPIRSRVHARFAKGDRAQLAALSAHDRAPVSMLLRFARILLAARLRGDHQRSPFFSASGELRVQPHVLSADELRDTETKRDDTSAKRSA